MIDVDIDRLDDADRMSALFSTGKPALFSFRKRDHGALEDVPLRPWAEKEFGKAGINVPDGAIRLITFPRHLFYKFAPLSLWIAMNGDDEPAAILYEVRNTFGEKHTYAAALEGRWSRHEAPKSFHVSPFFDVSGRYVFSLRYSAEELHLGVTTLSDGAPVHSATLVTRLKPVTTSVLAATAFKMPFSTIGVSLGIHWEALKLWIKGARYYRRPRKQAHSPTVAHKSSQTTEA